MGVQPAIIVIDPAVEAGDLADNFNDLSQALDEYRLKVRVPPCSGEELARLKDEAQMLEDRAHYFTAEAIGATLDLIRDDLSRIKLVSAQARTQFNELTEISKAIAVATALASLGAAIAAGNPATILAATKALEDILIPAAAS